MSKKLFTNEEIEILSKNIYVKNVTNKGITYTDEFKHLFIVENESGKLPRQIFENAGFDVNILGMKRVKSSANRWRTSYKYSGAIALQDTRKFNSGRPTTKSLSIEEKYARLEAQNKLLKAENELLKKLDMIERRVVKGK
jgi:transposase